MIRKNQRRFNSAGTVSKYNNLSQDQLFLTLLINLVSAAWSSCLLLVRRLTLRLKGKKNPDVRLRRIQRLESQFGATIYVLNRRKEYVLHGICNLLLY